MSLSVISVSYHTGPALFEMIEAVLAIVDVDELVIVNHGNPVEDVEKLDQWAAQHKRLNVVHTGANLGFAAGCNMGALIAKGDYLFFLNPDAFPDKTAPAQLVKSHAGFTEPVIMGARVLDLDGHDQRGSRRGELTVRAALLSFSKIFKGILGQHAFNWHETPLPQAPECVPTISGAAMLMSRAGFTRLGGFDEGFFLHVEDVDICKRARVSGGDVVFDPAARVRHIGATSTASPFAVEHHKAAGLIRYFWKHGGVWALAKVVCLAPLIYTGLFARAIIRSRSG